MTDIGHPAGRVCATARPPLAAEAVAKATLVPPAPNDQAGDKLGQVGTVSEVDKAGRGDRQAVQLSVA